MKNELTSIRGKRIIWIVISIFSAMGFIVLSCFAKNYYCRHLLEVSPASIRENDLFFHFLQMDGRSYVGHYNWPLGPFEYKDLSSGDWRWEE